MVACLLSVSKSELKKSRSWTLVNQRAKTNEVLKGLSDRTTLHARVRLYTKHTLGHTEEWNPQFAPGQLPRRLPNCEGRG